MKKTALFLIFLTVLSAVMLPMASASSDLTGHWSESFINSLSDKGIISGYADGSYRPDGLLKVDEFLKMVLKALGYEAENTDGYWASGIIKKAEELEIIDSDDFDDYARPVTRAQMAMIIANALNLKATSSDNSQIIGKIPDYYDILNYYKPSVLACYENNLFSGYDDGSFMAKRASTRAEASVIITRMLKLKPLDIDKNPSLQVFDTYYVALNGSDENSGTIESPFATVEKARDKIREIKANGELPEGGIDVVIRGGTYFVENTIELNELDSGTETGKITYKAYDGESVRFTGGIELPYEKFKKISSDMSDKLLSKEAKSKVLELDLNALGITDLGELSRRGYLVSAGVTPQAELYIDGSRQQLSRWPNEEWAGTSGIVRSGTRSQSGVLEGAVFKIDYDRPTKWKTNVNEIYTSGVLGENYFYGYFPIEKIEAGQVTLKEGAVKEYYSKHFIRYENVFEELDCEGEYYIDRSTGMLYLYPASGLSSSSDIRLSMLSERMLNLQNAKYIRFENIKFDTMRADAIRATNADNIEIVNCDVFGTGTGGISISGTNSTVESCHIRDIGSSGVSVSGGDYQNIVSGGNKIINNHIHKVSQIERSYTSGIYLGYRSVGAYVANNEVHDTPHVAIIAYGPEHLFEYNEVYDAVKEFMDMDAVYMNVNQYPWERGVVFRRNYFHDFGNEYFTEKQINVAAIRTDNNGNGLNVIENVFYNIGYENANGVRGICAEGVDNVIKNNIFVDVAETYDGPDGYSPDAKWDLTNSSVSAIYKDFETFSPKYSEKYPEVADFFKNHWKAKKQSNIFEGNLIASIKMPLSTLNATPNAQGFRADENLVLGKDNYITKKDPGFMDYAGGSFALTDSSEVYGKIADFPKIDFENIGLLRNTAVGTK